MTSQQFPTIWRHVADQNVGGVQLPEQSNYFVLGRCLIAFLLIQCVPEFLHCALAIHQSDKAIGRWRESVGSPASMILQDVPDLPAVIVTMQLRMLA